MNQNLNQIQYEKNTQSGRTMLEMLGVLAIMGLITYGAIAGINYGMTSYKINQMYSEVQDIVQGIEDLYSWNKVYPDSEKMMEAAKDNDIFSNSMAACSSGSGSCNDSDHSNCCAKGSFGDIKIAPTPDNKNFTVTYYNIPADSCARISEMDWKSFSVNYTLTYLGCASDCGCPENDFVTFTFTPNN